MAASMKASSSALVLLLLLAMAACCFQAAEPKGDADFAEDSGDDMVSRLCTNATSNFCHIHLTNKYCVSTLRLETRSARAKDPRDLALVAIDLAGRGAAAADAKAAGAMEHMSSEDAARALRYCRSDYAAVAHLAALCRGTVEAYRPRDVMRAYYSLECARNLVRAATNCRHVSLFQEELEEVLWKEVIDVARRTALVKAFVEEMIHMEDPIEGFDDYYSTTKYTQ